MRVRAAAACAAGVLAAALLAGCGPGQASPGVPEPPDPGDVAPSNPQWDDESPLDAYLREVLGEFESDDAYADPLRAPAEEAVAACMAEAGFEYHPMLEEPSYVSGGWRDLPHTVEVAEEFGYGFSIEAEGRGNGTARWSVPNQEGQAERANREYKESLSPAARAEYERVLLGDPLAVLEEGYDEIDRTLAESEYDAIRASVPAELAELQAAERAVAVADATCRDTSGYTRVETEVTLEYEQDLVDRYRDDLEAWVAQVRERQ
jgi:hypothetical protein